MSNHDFRRKKINFLEEPLEQDNYPEFIDNHQIPNTTDSKVIHPQLVKPKKKNGRRKRISYFFIFLIIIFSFFGKILASDNNSFLGGIKNSYLLRQIINIVSPGDKTLAGEDDDRINFLLLGMGGAGHSGPYLTDTIVLVSFQPSTQQASMISIPRDMIVPISDNNYKKINSVYSIGITSGKDAGQYAKEIIGQTLDIPIHYYGAVDFNGFVEIIDAIGGIDVEVDRAFTDHQFPTEDYKYQEISFKAGEQHMDGLTALRFSRSRHGNNGEGSDFARSKRQQKIIAAVKDKATSFNTLINPAKITNLFSLFNQYTTTDLEPWEAVRLIHLAKGLDTQKIIVRSIDNSAGGFLKAGISLDGAYILQPVTGSFSQIQQLVENIFSLGEVSDENAKIVIQNGTDIPGLAAKAVNHLNQMGYQVLRYGNAVDQEKIVTTVYQYNEDKPATKKTLEAIFNTKVNDNIPLEYSNSVVTQNWNIVDDQGNLEQLDFLIVLGNDQYPDNPDIITTIDPELLNSSSTTSTVEEINL